MTVAESDNFRTTGTDPHSPHGRPSRLLSVDVFRGIAVAGMLLVDYPGDEAAGYWPIRHSP